MDNLQIKHAISQIEIYQEQLKTHLIEGNNDTRVEELESELDDAESENDRLEDENNRLNDEVVELKTTQDEIRKILTDLVSRPAGADYYIEGIEKALELL